jgi:DNA-binding XRE family transcriptional regulator
MNLKGIRIQRGIKQKELAQSIGKDEPFLSRLEQYVYLPTPEVAKALCEQLNVSILDIYAREECDLLQLCSRNGATGNVTEDSSRGACRSPSPREPKIYRLSVRIPRHKFENILAKEILRKCGYRSITHWIDCCLNRLELQYSHITKSESKKNK